MVEGDAGGCSKLSMIEQAGACLIPAFVVAVHYGLRLKSVEEALHRRVVPTIPFAAHALANPVFPDEIQVQRGSVGCPMRQRAALVLQLEEREEISRGIAANRSIGNIAASIGSAPSSVSREIARHGGGIGIVHPKRTSKHGSRRAD